MKKFLQKILLCSIACTIVPTTHAITFKLSEETRNNAFKRAAKDIAEGATNALLKKYTIADIKKNINEETIRSYVNGAIEKICEKTHFNVDNLLNKVTKKIKSIIQNNGTENLAEKISRALVNELTKHTELVDMFYEKLEKFVQDEKNQKLLQTIVKDFSEDIADASGEKLEKIINTLVNNQDNQELVQKIGQACAQSMVNQVFDNIRENQDLISIITKQATDGMMDQAREKLDLLLHDEKNQSVIKNLVREHANQTVDRTYKQFKKIYPKLVLTGLGIGLIGQGARTENLLWKIVYLLAGAASTGYGLTNL